MARPGPKPLPSHLKALRGTDRADRRNPNEAKPKQGIPPCPEHLQGEARKQWRRLSKELARMGLLSQIDREALALLCQAWGRWMEAEQALQKYGLMVKSPSGFPMQSPYLAVANKAMEQIRQLLTEFGMSPSSRTRATALPVHDEEDELAAEYFGDLDAMRLRAQRSRRPGLGG